MISREQFDAYNRAVANLSDGAQREIESRIMSWLQTDEGRSASVAECREYAKSVMSGVVQVYDSAAASLAAEWYDKQAADSGARLPAAITATTYSPESVDETARYQAKKLAEGDPRGFAEYCGELGRNDVLRSLNETIMRNAARDRKRGVRFARVPTGAETCTYCLMLASRGAVYHSRKTAGEFRHFHRRCDCKVVPGFEDDPDATLVEGKSPKAMLMLYRACERIEARDDITNLEKGAIKSRLAALPLDGWDISDAGSVDNGSFEDFSGWKSRRALIAHAKKHAAEFGIDYRSLDGQNAYDRRFSQVLGAAERVYYRDDIAGQNGAICGVFISGEHIAVLNIEAGYRVTAFKHKEGVSGYYDAIWNQE